MHKKSKWITNGILKSINAKDKLYKVLIQTNSANTIFLYFIRQDDLLTCKNQQKTKQKQQQHKSTGKIIDNISLALMKQFNLFPVAMRMLTITHDQNIIYTSKYMYKKRKVNKTIIV